MMNVEKMLAFAGDFGPQQYILMGLFSLINILSAFHYFAQTFISVLPEGYECIPTITKNMTSTNVQRRSLTDMVLESNLIKSHHYERCYSPENQNLSCQNGWTYTLDYNYSSIVDELNWICNDAWKPVMGQSLFFIGSVCGSMALGVLADYIGRLHVLVLANLLAVVGNIITFLSNTLPTFAVGRFIAGTATDSNFVMMYIIVMEYIRPNMRTFGLNVCIGLFYCIGCMIVPWVAVYSQTWRTFLIFITLPLLIVLTFYIVVPESAQWLISRKRVDESIQCFQRIAKMNGKIIPETAIEDLKKYCEQNISTQKTGHLFGLFKTPCLRRKIFILIFKSMVITLCYDAISRNINGLGFSPFVMFTITSSAILPACLLILVLQDKVGRKAMACTSLFISGLFSSITGILITTVSNPDVYFTLGLALIARFGITVAYNSGAQYAVELIPTEVRGQGVAAIHVAGYAATFFSSHILYLGEFNRALPELILGFLSILGAVACLFLPETLNRTLPVTLEDGEQFGENEGVCDFACCLRAQSTSSTLQLVNSANDVKSHGSMQVK